MQALVDRTFYRLEYDYQETVKQISESMRSLIRLDDVKQTMMRLSLEPMFIDSGCILLRDKDRPAFESVFSVGEAEQRPQNALPTVASVSENPEDKSQPKSSASIKCRH